jgi:hypothetical protein
MLIIPTSANTVSNITIGFGLYWNQNYNKLIWNSIIIIIYKLKH